VVAVTLVESGPGLCTPLSYHDESVTLAGELGKADEAAGDCADYRRDHDQLSFAASGWSQRSVQSPIRSSTFGSSTMFSLLLPPTLRGCVTTSGGAGASCWQPRR
jgi:hypothetical protein